MLGIFRLRSEMSMSSWLAVYHSQRRLCNRRWHFASTIYCATSSLRDLRREFDWASRRILWWCCPISSTQCWNSQVNITDFDTLYEREDLEGLGHLENWVRVSRTLLRSKSITWVRWKDDVLYDKYGSGLCIQ